MKKTSLRRTSRRLDERRWKALDLSKSIYRHQLWGCGRRTRWIHHQLGAPHFADRLGGKALHWAHL